jgi:hypothetical protein
MKIIIKHSHIKKKVKKGKINYVIYFLNIYFNKQLNNYTI